MKYVIHPFLFAVFPILFLFSFNIDEVPGKDLILPLIVILTGVVVLLMLFKVITKKWTEAGIIVSYFLLFFFSYGHIRDMVFTPAAKIALSVNILLLLIWAPLLITGILVIQKFRRDYSILTKYLNVFASALVIVSLVSIGISQLRTIDKEINIETNDPVVLSIPDNPPDIYYIVLDMYAREDTLKEYLDYDNSEFTNFLTDREFYVATKGRSNYGSTQSSVSSSLNMNFTDSEDIKSYVTLEEAIANNKVSRLLKSVGYNYIYVNGGAQWKNMDRYADEVCTCTEVLGIEFSDFAYSFCESTLIAPIIRLLSGVGGAITFTQYGANSILYAFDMLATIPDIEEPTFTYAHILCPHPPAHFTREGPTKFVVLTFSSEEDFYPDGYLDNLVFITTKVEALVDAILSKSDTPPIIILQGDHGIWYENPKEVTEILNAYYLPGKSNTLLYETISPVNSFRVIFNLYFETDFELLDDRREYEDSPSE